MTKEDITRGLTFTSTPKKDDVTSRVGNKVLPVNESNTTSSSSNMNSSIVMKKENGDRTKTISRMKELLRWAAAVKSEKGGKYIARKVSIYFIIWFNFYSHIFVVEYKAKVVNCLIY